MVEQLEPRPLAPVGERGAALIDGEVGPARRRVQQRRLDDVGAAVDEDDVRRRDLGRGGLGDGAVGELDPLVDVPVSTSPPRSSLATQPAPLPRARARGGRRGCGGEGRGEGGGVEGGSLFIGR